MKYFLSYYLFLFVFFVSCSNEIENEMITKSNIKAETVQHRNIRNIVNAKDLAKDFINSNYYQDLKTKSSEKHQVKNVDVFRLKETKHKSGTYNNSFSKETIADTLLYSVNFNSGESIVISADKRIPPVIAMFENNFYFKDLEKEENSGLQYVLETITGNLLTYLEEQKQSKVAPAARTKNYQVNKDENDSKTWKLLRSVEPKVKVAWHQGEPFNKYTPLYTPNEHSAVGCVALAIGQAMTVLKPVNQYKGVTLDWDKIEKIQGSFDMYRNPKQADIIAKYLYNIGKSIGTSYGESSFAKTNKAISIASQDFKFNYTSIGSSHIRKHLSKNNNVVLMRGYAVKKKQWIFFNKYKEGHAFVLDGYKEYSHTSYDRHKDDYYTGYTGYTVYHINLGWGSSYNGFFLGSFKYISREWLRDHIDEDEDYPELYTYSSGETNLFWKENAPKEYKYKMDLYGLSNK